MLMGINEEFALSLLDEGGERPPRGRVVQLLGSRLIAQVSQYLKPNTCVRIDRDDALLLGEVIGCWREGVAIFVAVKLIQMLTGLDQLARFRQGHWEFPKWWILEVRKNA
jgi:hypothetical protein